MAVKAEPVAKKEKTDGRKQRSARSRDKIKTSILTLIRAGIYSPRAIDISEHSGLSMRTVFRHIDDMESLLREIAADIPDGIDWVIQVDGHTDNVPVSGTRGFDNNWELSQARALSVVLYMINCCI